MWDDDDDLNNRPLGKHLESNVNEFQRRLFRFQRQYGHISPICPTLRQAGIPPHPHTHLTPVQDGNVPEVHTQLLFEQNSLYLNTTGYAVHKADNGPTLRKKTPYPEHSSMASGGLSS